MTDTRSLTRQRDDARKLARGWRRCTLEIEAIARELEMHNASGCQSGVVILACQQILKRCRRGPI